VYRELERIRKSKERDEKMDSKESWNKFTNDLEEELKGNKQLFTVMKISVHQQKLIV
jgi:competence protein ComGF